MPFPEEDLDTILEAAGVPATVNGLNLTVIYRTSALAAGLFVASVESDTPYCKAKQSDVDRLGLDHDVQIVINGTVHVITAKTADNTGFIYLGLTRCS